MNKKSTPIRGAFSVINHKKTIHCNMANIENEPGYIAISPQEFEAMQKLQWLSGKDWQKAKGKWITIRQITKHGPMYRSLLAEDYVPFDEYENSENHSFIFLE